MDAPSSHLDVNITTFGARDEQAELLWQRPRIEQIRAILCRLPRVATVADVGCMGGYAARLYAEAGVSVLHGYDVSPDSLEKLRAKGFDGFLWNADGDPCPAAGDTYDVVIAGEIVEHLVDTDSFAREVRRILKPGGHLILSTPNLASWYNRVRLLRGLPPRSYPGTSSTIRKNLLIDNHHIRVNVLSEWEHFLVTHGFQVIEVQGTSHLHVLHGGWRPGVVRILDRLLSWRPSLAVNLIILARKPA